MKTKLMLVLPSMAGGGAEKVALLLLSSFDKEKYDIFLVLFKKEGEYLAQVPEHINIISLHKKTKFDVFALIWRLRNTFKRIKPDAILSFLTYTNAVSIISAFLSGYLEKIIISQRNYHKLEEDSKIKKFIYPFLYRMAKKIIVISKGLKDSLVTDWKVSADRICVIYNPVDLAKVILLKEENIEHPCFNKIQEGRIIINIGRLEKQKNQELLLMAFKNVLEKADAFLIILGKGSLRERLEKKAEELGIESRVYFVGFQNNPFTWLRRSDIFVLSSDFEGFGNVIIEAMACGVPVVSTDCPYGPGEIITHLENGLLVKPRDYEGLAEAITFVLSNPEVASRLRSNALQTVKQYDINRIGMQYEEVLKEVMFK